MSPSRKKKDKKKQNIAKRVTENDKVSNSVPNDDRVVSFDSPDDSVEYDSEFDEEGNFEILQKHFDQKVLKMKTMFEEKVKSMEIEFNAKVNTLHEIIETKDHIMNKLSEDVGYLKSELANIKESNNFLSQETSDLKQQALNSKDKYDHELHEIREKTVDLEDRSRRNNLVFFGVEETESPRDIENSGLLVLQKVLYGSGLIKPEDVNGHLLFISSVLLVF